MSSYPPSTKQPLYCSNCGTFFMGDPYANVICCCDDCREEISWKKALSCTGSKYRPRTKMMGDTPRKRAWEVDKCLEKPYSDKDYKKAGEQGLDLDNWRDYKTFYHLGEEEEQD